MSSKYSILDPDYAYKVQEAYEYLHAIKTKPGTSTSVCHDAGVFEKALDQGQEHPDNIRVRNSSGRMQRLSTFINQHYIKQYDDPYYAYRQITRNGYTWARIASGDLPHVIEKVFDDCGYVLGVTYADCGGGEGSMADWQLWMRLSEELDKAKDDSISKILGKLYTVTNASEKYSPVTPEMAQKILNAALGTLTEGAPAIEDPLLTAKKLCDTETGFLWPFVMEDMRLQTGLHNFYPILRDPDSAGKVTVTIAKIYSLLVLHYAAQELVDEALYATVAATLWAQIDTDMYIGSEAWLNRIDTVRANCEGALYYTLEPVLRPLLNAAGEESAEPQYQLWMKKPDAKESALVSWFNCSESLDIDEARERLLLLAYRFIMQGKLTDDAIIFHQ